MGYTHKLILPFISKHCSKVLTFFTLLMLFLSTKAQEPTLNYCSSNKLLINPSSGLENDYISDNWNINAGVYLNSDQNRNLFSTYNINGGFNIGSAYLGAIINNSSYKNNQTFSFEGLFSKSLIFEKFVLSGGIKVGFCNQNMVPQNITDRYNPHFLTDTSKMETSNKTYPLIGAGLMAHIRLNSDVFHNISCGISASNINQPVEFSDKKKSKLPIKYFGLLKGDFYIRKNTLIASLVYEFRDRRIYDDLLNKYLLSNVNDLAFFLQDKYHWLIVGYGFHYLFEKTPANFIRLGYSSNFSVTYDIGVIHPIVKKKRYCFIK